MFTAFRQYHYTYIRCIADAAQNITPPPSGATTRSPPSLPALWRPTRHNLPNVRSVNSSGQVTSPVVAAESICEALAIAARPIATKAKAKAPRLAKALAAPFLLATPPLLAMSRISTERQTKNQLLKRQRSSKAFQFHLNACCGTRAQSTHLLEEFLRQYQVPPLTTRGWRFPSWAQAAFQPNAAFEPGAVQCPQ